MATCKYCGKSSGLFSRVHKECEEKHKAGLTGLFKLMQRYFDGQISASEMGQKIARNRNPYFLSAEDIENTASQILNRFGNTLRRPYPSDTLPKIKGFIDNVGISYAELNAKGTLDNLAQKLFQGYVVDFFAKGIPLSQIKISTDSVTSVLPLSHQQQDEAYYNVLNKATDKFMADGFLSDQEEKQLMAYSSGLGIALNSLPIQYRNSNLLRVSQAIILKDLQRGVLPKNPLTVPVMLSKGEAVLWEYDNVTIYQEKITREYVGGSRGMSYRLFKGMTFRTGSFKGRPVEKSHMETIGNGSLVVTNKNFFFHCPTASVKIPYSKLVGVTPYSDGLEVHKEEAKPKRTVFQGFDAWFPMNVLAQVNKL